MGATVVSELCCVLGNGSSGVNCKYFLSFLYAVLSVSWQHSTDEMNNAK